MEKTCNTQTIEDFNSINIILWNLKFNESSLGGWFWISQFYNLVLSCSCIYIALQLYEGHVHFLDSINLHIHIELQTQENQIKDGYLPFSIAIHITKSRKHISMCT
jgi:hypothetical protein